MTKLTGSEVTSYTGAATSITLSLTLTDIGIIVGIVTALLTFGLNALYTYRKDKREQMETEARLRGKK